MSTHSTIHPGVAPPARFDGWRAVAAAFVVAVFGWGIGFYGPPVYLEAVRQQNGWPIALVSGAVTLHFLAGVGVVANLPRLHARFGLPAVTVAGAALLAIGVVGWSLAGSPWQLYAASLLTGAGWPALGAAAVNAIVAPWFVAKRPAALSMAYNGASIGGVVFSPLWVLLIERVGFPAAALGIGAVTLVAIGGLALGPLRRTPETTGQSPDGGEAAGSGVVAASVSPPPVERLSGDRAFVTLALGMALALFAQIGLLAQLVSLLVPVLGTRGAGLAAGLSTASAILGRLAVGWFMPPRLDRRVVASASLAVQAVGMAVLWRAGGESAWPILLGVVLVGLGIGNATSLPPLIAQVEFAKAQSIRVVALIVAVSQAAYAFAPAIFGLVRQTIADGAIFGLAIAVQAAAVAAYLAGAGAAARRRGGIGLP